MYKKSIKYKYAKLFFSIRRNTQIRKKKSFVRERNLNNVE